MAKPPVKAAKPAQESKNRNVAEFEGDGTAVVAAVDALLRVPVLPTGEDYIEEGLRSYSRSGLEMARAGRCWQLAKDQIGHGGFMAAIEKAGVSGDHVQRAMQLAGFLGRLPEGEARKLASQPYTKVLALAKADPEVVDDLVQSGEIDAVGSLSVRELRERLRKADRDQANLQTRLDTAENRARMLARQGAALQTEEDLPHFALIVRQEAMALTEQMGFCLDNLEAIAGEHLLQEVKHPEAAKWQPVAASTYWHALAAVHARAQVLLRRIEGTFEGAVGAIDLDVQLSPVEIKRHIEGRDLLLAQHQAKAKARDDARENNKPGKRGAKRKG